MSFGDNRIAAFTMTNLARSVKWTGSFVDNRIDPGCVEDATKRGQTKSE